MNLAKMSSCFEQKTECVHLLPDTGPNCFIKNRTFSFRIQQWNNIRQLYLCFQKLASDKNEYRNLRYQSDWLLVYQVQDFYASKVPSKINSIYVRKADVLLVQQCAHLYHYLRHFFDKLVTDTIVTHYVLLNCTVDQQQMLLFAMHSPAIYKDYVFPVNHIFIPVILDYDKRGCGTHFENKQIRFVSTSGFDQVEHCNFSLCLAKDQTIDFYEDFAREYSRFEKCSWFQRLADAWICLADSSLYVFCRREINEESMFLEYIVHSDKQRRLFLSTAERIDTNTFRFDFKCKPCSLVLIKNGAWTQFDCHDFYWRTKALLTTTKGVSQIDAVGADYF